MADVLHFMEGEARRRAAELRAGQGFVTLRDGPKWICRIASEPADQLRWNNCPLSREVANSLVRLDPAGVTLCDTRIWSDSWLAISPADDEERHKGYAYVGLDRTIEMVGVLSVGVWADAFRSWWPGTYELPMLKMLTTTIRSLLDRLVQGTTSYLFMTLTDIEGTAIVAESKGIERAFPIPTGVDMIHFAPVRLDDSPASCAALTASFNRIRQIAGVEKSAPFYL